MKKIFYIVVILLSASYLSAQTQFRTVKLTFSGYTNYSTLTDALNGALSGTTICVAAGTYQENELIIPAGVTVIGGFPTSSTNPTQRVYPGATTTQLSILDGKYAHRVATVIGTLDGCVITKGYAYNTNGGGVLITGGTVQNCILTNNIASSRPSSPSTIPGTYSASVGDIYCKGLNGNDTIIRPLYTLSQTTGILSATYLGSGSIVLPAGKVVEGIVFYVDPAPTKRLLYLVSMPISGKGWSGSYNTFDSPIKNESNYSVANSDFYGKTHTDSVINYVNSQIPIWNSNYQTDRTNDWNNSSAFVAVNNYNSPSGTKGEWYFPAAGEIVKLVDVKKQIDACAVLLQWITSGSTLFQQGIYLSSTEIDSKNEWVFDANSNWNNAGLIPNDKKAGGSYTFPVTKKTY